MASIRITGSNIATQQLVMDDNGLSGVKRGEQVTWIIAPNSGVYEIVHITAYPNSTDIFNPDPSPAGSSSNWQGTVSQTIPIGSQETYYINWRAIPGGPIYFFDPRIIVNP